MAGTTDPRAADFVADDFRSAIRFAMVMGAPNQASDKVTFRWTDKKTYAVQDPDRKPYDWTESPSTDVTHPDVVIDEVAPELTEPRVGSIQGTALGAFDQIRAKITILDVDFARIGGFDDPPNLPDIVLIDGDPYEIHFVSSTALFDVDIYQVHASAVDVN